MRSIGTMTAPDRRMNAIKLLTAFLTLIWSAQSAAAGPPNYAQIDFGKKQYSLHCASCHGVSGKGDGFVAGALAQPPPDLTKIVARRGFFPERELAETIDGRRVVRAHG